VGDNGTADFAEIRRHVDGRSDTDIHSWIAARDGGADGLLDLVFANMPGAFLPERAGGREIDFQYEIETPEGARAYFASVRGGRCHCGRGRVETPSVTMAMDMPTFLRVLTGDLAPVRAFLTRKIRVTGDMMAATKFESWFSRA
jgi:putative sterol carrier protein